MKLRTYLMLALLWAVAQGVWAQWAHVDNEVQLLQALADGQKNIKLDFDIQLSSYLNIENVTVTIDLNGHKLSRNLSDYDRAGHVIWAHGGSNLTLTSGVAGGSIEGGMAYNGGAIHIPNGNTVSATNVIFQNNSAFEHAGAIWNNGTFTATNCTFTDNTASDVGGIYNSVTEDGEGTATLTGCTFERNAGTAGAGALGNALGATVMTIENCTIKGNTASGHGGGVWNGGTLTVTNSAFTNNTANDVGGIYNAVSTDGTTAGTAILTGCTFTGNTGTAGAGALANAIGNTVMTIDGGTIENNTAYEYGGGIWNGGTLNMKGEITVKDNKNGSDAVSNVYLKIEKVITVTGALTTGSNIGVDLESLAGTFTSGYKTYNNGIAPSTFFTADHSDIGNIELDDDGEACLTPSDFTPVSYIERSWDSSNEKVVSTQKALKGIMIGYDATPIEGQYKEVTDAPASTPDEWFRMGGYNDHVAEFYVVHGDVIRETIVVQGKNVHLILCDRATLTLTGGLKLEDDNKLYIHCQSYGDDMGRLMVTNKYENAAGIGSAVHEGNENTVGELVIYGGHIEATGGESAAGIGSCKRTKDEDLELCKSITVYGGYVKTTGGKEGAGIGVGRYNNYFHSAGGDFYLYDGTVLAVGGESASGVGGGGRCPGINVMVYGGSLTALGGEDGAGIGSGSDYHGGRYGTQCGGTCTIFGGTVTAIGGKNGAGIGGGKLCGGAEVNISGGRVMASGGRDGAGIGGGLYGFGGVVTISGGTVSATGGENASGIGGGYKGKGGDVNITGGTVIAQTTDGAYGPGSAIGEGADSYKGMGELYIGDAMMVGAGNNGSVESILDAAERVDGCWFQYYAEISPCTHPSGLTYTINEDGSHTTHCKHCSLSETVSHSFSDDNGACICGYKKGGVYHTITVATSRDGSSYEGVGVIANVGNNKPYTLPVCSSIPEGYDFAGWAVNPTNHNGIRPNGDEELKQAGENITVTGDVSIFARYKDITISLADDSDNAETLYTYDGKKATSVTLTGRTLYKDGDWNTLCLPFEVSTTSEPLSGDGVVAMTLDTENCGFSNGTLTLNFTDVAGNPIPAGTPFIIKWPNDANNPTIVDPTFTNVTISKELNDQTCTINDEMSITFKGTYAPVSFDEEGDNSVLYLGDANTLYYPSGAMTIGAQRAFFQLNGLTAGEPEEATTTGSLIKAFNLNFGEETGIREMEDVRGKMEDAWFSLDGLRLLDKPTSKGLYIHNGVKVLIK